MTPPVRRSFRVALVWITLVVAAAWGVLYWWRLGVPVSIPDAPDARIACVSYAPFRRPGQTPFDPNTVISPAQIDADLKVLSKRFDCVRTYSEDHGLAVVPEIAKRYGMHVLLGIWLSSVSAENAREVATGIRVARAHPHTVRAIIVGNEVLLRGDLPPARLVQYIREVRAATHLPVSYADVWEYWLRYGHQAGLADAVSFLTIHILPYWENHPVAVGRAITHLADVYRRVQQSFPGKSILIGETGWPSEGRPRRGAVPSRVNEARYIREFLRYAAAHHIAYNVIESFDQPWKRAQEGTVGGYWGLYNTHARPKFALQGPVVEESDWWLGWIAAGGAGALFVWWAGTGWRRRVAGMAAGIATGAALAEAGRQMYYALASPFQWAVGVLVCAAALLTALASARRVAAWLVDPDGRTEAASRAVRWVATFTAGHMRSLWLIAIAYVDVLLVFGGRYRDYPVAAMLVPALALALHRFVDASADIRTDAEHRLLALWILGAAVELIIYAHAANAAVWSWALCNVLVGVPVVLAWRAASAPQLQSHEAQYSDQ